MARQPTWQEVADILGDRLEYQAHQCPIADSGSGETAVIEGGNIVGVVVDEDRASHDRESCPFCKDTDAVLVYRRKQQASR